LLTKKPKKLTTKTCHYSNFSIMDDGW